MNYRHAFHAGSFADVFKHAILTRVLVHLCGKAAPFRVIDIHAGAGLYDLASDEAERTGEWRDGIARLFDAALPADAGALLAPYLAAVRSFNPDGALRH
jgi:23S rRNA (adenine2030-N6)-methyltransferase